MSRIRIEVDLRTTVASRLRAACEADGRTLTEIGVAAFPHIARSSAYKQVQRLTSETDPTWPSPTMLAAMAHALGLDAEQALDVVGGWHDK